MKLKSMKIIGFKSFAHQTTINFETGLTAIVGPNGSGKSNVIEAIRWVLGEQSAKNLRGNKMADVIFSGSNTHRAMNRAEVSLTFDNSDHYLASPYSELTITRRIFRDGQGGYFLNHQECRLKDINDLLLDSGIGKGSFSIISQGNVEQIFNSKPAERRTIIETTAGIYKYKLQKQQAEDKLSETDANLHRVNDIVYELTDQVKSLKTASQAAQHYLEIKKRLSKLSDLQMIHRLTLLNQQHHDQVTDQKRLMTQIDQTKSQRQALMEQRKTLQNRLQRLLEQNDQLQTQLLDGSAQLEKQIGQQKLLSQQQDQQTKRLNELTHDLEMTRSKLANLYHQSNLVQHNYDQADEQLNQLNQQVAELNDEQINHQLTELNQQLHQLHNQRFALNQRLNDLDNKIEQQKRTRQQSQVHFNELQQQLKQGQKRLSKAQQQLAALQQRQTTLSQQDRDNQRQLKQQTQQLQLNEKYFNQAQENWYNQLQQYQQLKSQTAGIKRMLDQHVGFYQGSQSLLRAKQRGVLGAVADFINVDHQYVLAIETALGGRLQQIIVDNQQVAQRAFQYLKQHRLGRVTLLPKNDLTEHHLPHHVLTQLAQEADFIAVADQLVQFPDALELVKRHLLGNVLVVKNLTAAFQISALIKRRFKVVTLTGEVVNAGGSVTGGASKQQKLGLLTQQTELKRRLQQSKVLDLTVQKSEQHLQKVKQQLQEQRQRIAELKKVINNCQPALIKVNGQMQTTINLVKDLSERSDEIKAQINVAAPQQFQSTNDCHRDEVNQQINNNQRQIDHINQVIQNLNDSQATTNQDARQLGKRLEKCRQQTIDLRVKLSGLKLQIEEQKKQLDNLQRQKLRLKQPQQTDFSDKQTHLQLSIQETRNQFRQGQHKIDNNKQMMHKLQIKQTPLEDKLNQFQEALLDDRRRLDQITGTIDSTANQIQHLKASLNEQPHPLKVDPAQIEIDKVNQEIATLNQQLMDLGPVNINAIEEFRSVNERYQFLVGQANDLKQSKDQLTQTMTQMDQMVKKRFKTTFDQIQVAFKHVFRSIFGGGDAKLILDDPHHLLTTGIEIMAQPPGKKYRNMSLLSGGERALTAIALLFGIIRLHPVPFCILDEAESALDSANVDRFARYINHLKHQTQFIVITHRKETMVYADQLYGITMQNSGVSQIIDVNLKQIQQTEE